MIRINRLLLGFLWLVLSGAGCIKNKNDQVEQQEAPSVPIIAQPTINQDAVEVEWTRDGSTLTIKPTGIPADATAVTCQVNGGEVVDCREGITIENIRDGSYRVIVIVETPGGRKESLHTFQVRGDELEDITTEPPASDKLEIKVASGIENYEALKRTESRLVKFHVYGPVGCNPHIMCARVPGMWALCQAENKPERLVRSKEILAGFQQLYVKAQCQDSDEVSEVMTVDFFGVPENYENLMMSRREIRSISHFRLIKQADCPGTLSFQCRDSQDGEFATCPNIKVDIVTGFSIRAVCESQSGVQLGPEYIHP